MPSDHQVLDNHRDKTRRQSERCKRDEFEAESTAVKAGFIPDAVFEVNEPMVISETIDGETVIINLIKGSYYSLKDSGAAIWSGILRSAPMADIAQMIHSMFDVGEADVEIEIGGLIDRLVEEDLVRPVAEAVPTSSPAVPRVGFASVPFSPPTLQKFTDMEAMLLLDPVHDVDDEGWPHLPGEGGRADV